MQTEVKEIGPCKLSVKIEIPKTQVKEKLTAKYKDFITETVVPGFRKGHAPQTLVEHKFGKYIKEDAKMDLIREAYEKVLEEKKLFPIMEPTIEAEKITLDENNPLSFEFTVEVNPTIEIPKEKYTGVKVKKVKVEVKEKDIKDAMEQLRYAAREYVPAPAGAAIEKDDLMVIDEEMSLEGKVINKQENTQVTVGQEVNIFRKPSPEVAEALTKMKPGETKEFPLTVPADYQKKELAGKAAVLKITLKEHKKQKLPTVNDAWAKEMNFDSLDALKKEMEKRIREEKEKAAEHQTENEIIQQLLKVNDFALPETLINAGMEDFQKRHAMYLYYQGVPEAEIKTQLEKDKATNQEAVLKDLKSHYILENVAKQEKIYVTEDEVTAQINEIASRNRKWPNEVRAHYEKNNQMRQLRSDLKEAKVRKFLREKAQITE